MTRAKGRKIRAIRIEEAMAEGAAVGGPGEGDPEGGVEVMAAKVMKSARKCMNS